MLMGLCSGADLAPPRAFVSPPSLFCWFLPVMMSLSLLYTAVALLLGLMILTWLWQRWGRKTGSLRVRHFAFPTRWLEILERNVPLYRRLPVDLRDQLQDRIIQFVDGKRWKHCGGLESVTDEMKITIAGQACFLLLNRGYGQNFSKVLTIMVYPSAAAASDDPENALPPVDSWPSASVLLAWDEVKRTARDLRDERNEVIHEFARQLDLEDGREDGTPRLQDQLQHTAWARVMSREFFQIHQSDKTDPGWLSETAGNPAEVFAASTELFFQLPEQLKRKNPGLYGLLCSFYKLDPAQWLKR